MAITQETFVREVLMVRETRSAPWAIHQKKIVVTSGAVDPIADAYREAEQLALADLDGVLDAIFVDLTHERDLLAAQLAAANARIAELSEASADQ